MQSEEWVEKLKSEGIKNLDFYYSPSLILSDHFQVKFSKLRSLRIKVELDDWTGHGNSFSISCEGGAKRVCSYLKSKFDNKRKHGKGLWWHGPIPGNTEEEMYQWVSEFLKDFDFILGVIYSK